MIILNFSHPLTDDHVATIETLTGQTIEDVRNVKVQFDTDKDFVEQAVDLINSTEISSEDWQQKAWLVVLPSLNYIAAVMLAELHGRMGRFPAMLRQRPNNDGFVTTYDVAEIINLEHVRQESRKRR